MDSVRIHIPNELFMPAESMHFEGVLDLPVMKAGPDLYSISEPVAWQVDITNTGEALLIMGTAEAAAKTSCARCLTEVEYDLMGEVEGYFLFNGEEGPDSDEMEGDEFDVLPDDHIIDLEPLVIAALMLEVDLIPLCADDCKGLCATCGADLNEGPCGCEAEEDEDLELAKNPFAALKDFQFDSACHPEERSDEGSLSSQE